MRSSWETKPFPQALWLYIVRTLTGDLCDTERCEGTLLPTTLRLSDTYIGKIIQHTDKGVRSEGHTKKRQRYYSRKQQKSLSTQFQPQVDFSEFGPMCRKLLAGSELGSFCKSEGNSGPAPLPLLLRYVYIYLSRNIHRMFKYRARNLYSRLRILL